MSHFKVLCECCGKVMEQCRCPSPDKIITYKVCDSCKEANKEKAYTRQNVTGIIQVRFAQRRQY